jgi:imidazolonepropionase-like amidohydrolase
VVFVAAAVAPGAFGAHIKFESPMAITHVKLVSDSKSAVEDATIVIDNGRIVAAGDNVTIPANARILDAKDLIAYPGFIDAQTHLGLPKEVRSEAARVAVEDKNPDHRQGPLPATRAANRKGVRPEWRAFDHYRPESKAVGGHRGHGFTNALIAPRDGIFSGTSDLVELSDAPLRRAILSERVAMHASFSTGESGGYPRTLLGVMAQFRQVVLDAKHHVKMHKYVDRHPQTAQPAPVDRALEALQPALAGRERVFLEANSEREIRRALRLADEFGLRIVLCGCREAWKLSDEILRRRIPLIVGIKFAEKPKRYKQAKSEVKGKDASPRIYEPLRAYNERIRIWEENVTNVVKLHRAGIPFSLRTRDFDKAPEFFKNLRLVMAHGLPVEAAVKALSESPASLFGAENRLGRIEAGFLANIVLVDKPLNEKSAKVKHVIVRGQRFDVDKKSSDDEKKKGKKGDKARGPGKQVKEDKPVDPHNFEPETPPVSHDGEEDESADEDEKKEDDESEEDDKKEDEPGPRFAVEIEADRYPRSPRDAQRLDTDSRGKNHRPVVGHPGGTRCQDHRWKGPLRHARDY